MAAGLGINVLRTPCGSSGTGVGSNRLLSLVAEWPRLTSAFGRRAFQESGNSRWAIRLFRELADRRLVRREDTRPYRYTVTMPGYSLLAARDRVGNSVMLSGVRGPVEALGRRLQAHEDGLMDAVGYFLEAGLPAASGWRNWEYLTSGSLMPDAMVYVSDGPYGPGWHHLEYERYVRGRFRAERKLKGYLSPERRENWPLFDGGLG